jgi:hypothetical protein
MRLCAWTTLTSTAGNVYKFRRQMMCKRTGVQVCGRWVGMWVGMSVAYAAATLPSLLLLLLLLSPLHRSCRGHHHCSAVAITSWSSWSPSLLCCRHHVVVVMVTITALLSPSHCGCHRRCHHCPHLVVVVIKAEEGANENDQDTNVRDATVV